VSEFKGTPGPLHVQQDSQWPYNIRVCEHSGATIYSEHLICSSSSWKGLDDARNLVGIYGVERDEWSALMERQMADMQLRAAAPDLLEALEGAIGALEQDLDAGRDSGDADWEGIAYQRLEAAKAAIAKALQP